MRRLFAAALSALLIFLSPGLAPYQAFAAQSSGPKGPSGKPEIAALPQLPSSAIPTVPGAPALPGPVAVPTTDAVKGTVPGIAGAPASAVETPGAANSGTVPLKPVVERMATGPEIAAPGAPAAALVTAQQSLATGVEQLAQARGDGEKRGILDRLFGGLVRRIVNSGDAPSGDAPAAPAPAAAPEPLSQLTVAELKASAADSKRPRVERESAIKAIVKLAEQQPAEAKAALEEIGTGNPDGLADDYEVKRLSLRSLKALGKTVSLPPVSAAHAEALLAKLRAEKPDMVASDYDDTLEKYRTPLARETAELVKKVADRGIEFMVLTNRPYAPESDKQDDSIPTSLASMTPAERASISLGARDGAVIALFDKRGEPHVLSTETGWTPEERTAIEKASKAVAARYPPGEFGGKTESLSDYGYVMFLKPGTPASDVAEAAALLQFELGKLGVERDVTGRTPKDPANPPYITLSRVDKSLGMLKLRRMREAFIRLRSAYRWLPRGLHKAAERFLGKPSAEAVPVSNILILGDFFFLEKNVDTAMTKGAPGALTISVGGKADPDIDNIFVWPTSGPAGTRQILGALAETPAAGAAGSMDKKGIFGLFAQRTISIAAFVLTALAYPFVAIPAVGASGYGALMALGTLAAIATGPLNGLIAKKMSSRGAMTFNTMMRAVLALTLPLFSAFGILNFGTLLVASIANGWLLSSIMTTENIYVRRMAGRNVGTVNALVWMNYLMIQVVMGLILGVGSLIDKMNLMLPFYVSAAVHVVLILPIILLTIPNVAAPKDAAPAAAVAEPTSRARKAYEATAAFMKRFWKEAAIFAAGVALFPLIGSTIPATLGLLYWISRTEGFKLIWDNKPLRYGILFSTLLAAVLYPMQNFSLPLMAETIAGKAGKSFLLGQLLGALFFGQLIANTSQAKLPKIKLPLIGRFGAQRLVQGIVLGLVATWVYTGLMPGSLLATAAAVALGAGLMRLSGKLTNRGWLRFLALGLPFIFLPLLSWGSVPLLFASILVIGLFQGPANVSLMTYNMAKIPKAQMETITGVQGSLFNAAISLGYGVISLLPHLLSPVFPAGLWIIGVLFAAAGLAFLVAPRFLPGLAKTSLQPKEGDKK